MRGKRRHGDATRARADEPPSRSAAEAIPERSGPTVGVGRGAVLDANNRIIQLLCKRPGARAKTPFVELMMKANVWHSPRLLTGCQFSCCILGLGVEVPVREAVSRTSVFRQAVCVSAHDLGLRVIPWTVNRRAAMRRLIGWGVDGLITDRPDVAVAVTR